jgi:hypothetical protein
LGHLNETRIALNDHNEEARLYEMIKELSSPRTRTTTTAGVCSI